MGKWLKKIGFIAAIPILVVVLFLLAALIGALIPSRADKLTDIEKPAEPIYLIGTILHQDIAIPINRLSSQQFSFLSEHGFPLDHPELEYLVIGWGARDFYTQMANYLDMDFGTVFRAVTGDHSVIHISPSKDVSQFSSVIEIPITEEGFIRLLSYFEENFMLSQNVPIIVDNASFGQGDLFFEARGGFNIFQPCNVWVSNALIQSGVNTGMWTPTTYSLKLAVYLYNS